MEDFEAPQYRLLDDKMVEFEEFRYFGHMAQDFKDLLHVDMFIRLYQLTHAFQKVVLDQEDTDNVILIV